MGLIISLALTIIGWQVMQFLKVPAAPLLGPMLFVGMGELTALPLSPLPGPALMVLQLLLGLFVGIKIDREKVNFLKQGMVVPSLMIVAWTIVSALVVIVLLARMTNLDMATILFGATPGGMAEMSIVAMSYGADLAAVSLLQFLRLVMVIILIPLIAAKVQDSAGQETVRETSADLAAEEKPAFGELVPVFGSGLLLGGLCMYLGFPAGGIIGGSVGVGAAGIYLDRKATLPNNLLKTAQLGIGLTIGTHFQPDTLMGLARLIIPGLFFSVMMVVSGILLAFALRHLTKWDLSTALLCTAPAGVSQIVIVATELGEDLVKITYFHLLRLMTIYLIINQFYQWYLAP